LNRNKRILQRKAQSKKYLENRISFNRNAERDFDEWSANLLPKLPLKINMLDLGCGTGKQINLFSQFFSSDSKITALDKSEESLVNLKKNYRGLPELNVRNVDFKNFSDCFKDDDGAFDLAYSFYALYYADNLEEIVAKVYKLLKKGGIFWIVSPFVGTNKEIFRVIRRFYTLSEKVIYSIDQFYKDVISISNKSGFKKLKVDIFKNKIIYDTRERLMEYLHSTTFYVRKYESKLSEEIDRVFISTDDFRLTKNAISIKLEK